MQPGRAIVQYIEGMRKHSPNLVRCIQQQTNMVTASYLSPGLKEQHSAAAAAGVTVVNEVRLNKPMLFSN